LRARVSIRLAAGSGQADRDKRLPRSSGKERGDDQPQGFPVEDRVGDSEQEHLLRF